ncbi:Sodium-potassium/proton antiporter ChaA [Diplonema papillatum]|nr:Sodium-potassium/proton antiporter ChaA [Diplonema papillatum]
MGTHNDYGSTTLFPDAGNTRASVGHCSTTSFKSSMKELRNSRASYSSMNRRSWQSGEHVPRPSLTMPEEPISIAAESVTAADVMKQEYHLLFGFSAAIFFFIWASDHNTLEDLSTPLFVMVFAVIFFIILWHAFAVVRHADCLAVKLGEPYGTLILTLSVITIEVIMMVALIITGDEPTLARDTMFSVVMIVLNGMVGVTLVLGGLRHEQQSFNLQSSQTFLNVILPLSVLGLIVPRFTQGGAKDEDGIVIPGTVSTGHAIFLIVMNVFLYGGFLIVQTMFHPDFFMHDSSDYECKEPLDTEALVRDAVELQKEAGQLHDAVQESNQNDTDESEALSRDLNRVLRQHSRLTTQIYGIHKQLNGEDVATVEKQDGLTVFNEEPHDDEHAGLVIRSLRYHALLLLLSVVPISLLAEKLAILVEKLVKDMNAPHAFAGFVVAILVLSPEAMGAARAALKNKIQRTINIALGSALSTIGLTIPSVVTISLVLDKTLVLGLPPVTIVELVLTLAATLTTFLGGRTNLLQGFVHIVLFVSYIVLLFEQKDAHD